MATTRDRKALAEKLNKIVATKQQPLRVAPPTAAVKAASMSRYEPDYPTRESRVAAAQLLDPGEMFAGKSVAFNRYIMDFINDSGYGSNPNPYTEGQLLMAYMTSVYLFAALRRVSNLISRVRVVAEIKQGSKYVRAPETVLINRIFERDGSLAFARMYLNYAIYGGAICYKVKTMKAVLEQARETPIYDYKDNAVAGLHVLDKPMWELDEDTYNAEINGVYVSQGSKYVGSRNYLRREEFIYTTDWNPENPNRGRSIATVAIHEAVTNASIARWGAEYFTRGAMPFILVALEDDPAMVTDTDLLKYKRQFEDHWQGVGGSLRSVFMDRKVNVEQVGVPAGDIAAPELNNNALAGISAAVGLDRELIVTPEGGTQERHAVLVKRAWDDTVIPLAESFVRAFEQQLGLPDGMRLALDLSHIKELEADRADKAAVERDMYNDSLQTYNETRQRMDMQPIHELDGYFKTDQGLVPIHRVTERGRIPLQDVREAQAQWFEKGLTTLNEYRISMGMPQLKGFDDVVLMDNKPIRIEDLLLGLFEPDESTVTRETSLMEKGLRSFNEIRDTLGLKDVEGMDDVFFLDNQPYTLTRLLAKVNAPNRDQIDGEISKFNEGATTYNELRLALGMQPTKGFETFHKNNGELMSEARILRQDKLLDEKLIQQVGDLWNNNLLLRSGAMKMLGIPNPVGMTDGYKTEIEGLMQFVADKRTKLFDKKLEAESGGDAGGGGGGGHGGWRSLSKDNKAVNEEAMQHMVKANAILAGLVDLIATDIRGGGSKKRNLASVPV